MVANLSHRDPQFDCSIQTAHDGCPEADEEKHSSERSKELRA